MDQRSLTDLWRAVARRVLDASFSYEGAARLLGMSPDDLHALLHRDASLQVA